MNKKFFVYLFVLIAIVLFVCFLFLRSNEDYWLCKDNQWIKHGNPDSNMPTSRCRENKIDLPNGYTLDKYIIEKNTDVFCIKDEECKTPDEYLLQSRCPFISLCLEKKCSIVCPSMNIQ
ncbi:MAG: hypothetical protein WCR40_00410 [Candidatus Paceibacterota bacterium]